MNIVVNGVEWILYGTAIIYGALILPRSNHSPIYKVAVPIIIASLGYSLPWAVNILLAIMKDANLFG